MASLQTEARAPRKGRSGATRPDPAAGKLARYHEKRDFARTAEPAEGGVAGRGIFVVQHHWARREHYDVRLELDGVLVSFAVTKGPSLDPKVRRLAVRTEDHPISYAEFEGTIPKGEYGGGTVMLWDRGVWAPISPDPQAALAAGELKFVVLGERMQGAWVLVRMNVEKGRENWLLIKERDEWARPGDETFPAAFDTSVTTGRSRAAIEAEETPHSFAADRAVEEKAGAGEEHAAPEPAGDRGAARSRTTGNRREKATAKADPKPAKRRGPSPAASATPASEPPAFLPPTLCELRDAAPEGDAWWHEVKYDGYRIEAAVSGGTVRLHSREGLDWTHRFPTLVPAFAALALDRVLLDGEAVVFDAAGLTDFPALVEALDTPSGAIAYVAFDCLAAGGEDLTALPLSARKARLTELLSGADGHRIRIAPHLVGSGPAVFESAVKGGAEGIVCKRADAPYRGGRDPAWVKVKGEKREDVVVVGWLPSDKRGFRSLHCAAEVGGRLRYVGGVGTGFSQAEIARTVDRLAADRRDGPPPDLDGADRAPKGLVWVEPRWRIEVRLAGWTGEGNLRQARFLGWREDRAPREATMATAKTAKTATAATAPAAPRRSRAKAGDDSPFARISHPERVMYPEAGVTKLDVAKHFCAVSDRIMPHLKGRPVSFVRAPEGLAGETFFQRHPLPGMKRGVTPIPDPEGRHGDYLGIDSTEGLVTAAQFGVLELHGWNAVLPDLRAPDRMVFDFDPDEGLGFDAVKEAAFAVREILTSVGLTSFAMASGGKGLHVIAPLDATQTFDDLGDFTGGIAKGLAKSQPKRFVAVASKERRKGRIFIDWLRNRPYSTAVVPWSLRARPKASVATPLAWDEVEGLPSADAFTAADVVERKDPWTGFWDVKQTMDPQALTFLRKQGK